MAYTSDPALLGQGIMDLIKGVASDKSHYTSVVLGATIQKYLKQTVYK